MFYLILYFTFLCVPLVWALPLEMQDDNFAENELDENELDEIDVSSFSRCFNSNYCAIFENVQMIAIH